VKLVEKEQGTTHLPVGDCARQTSDAYRGDVAGLQPWAVRRRGAAMVVRAYSCDTAGSRVDARECHHASYNLKNGSNQ
jgi:hypothetical protein